MKLKVALGADHGGFHMKNEMVKRLDDAFEVIDMGACTYEPDDDYPDVTLAVARLVASGEVDRGIIICGSGVGACIAANKVSGVRACLCHDTYSAHQGVEHDDMNVLCLGARIIGNELAVELTLAFLKAAFLDRPRYHRRLKKVLDIEREYWRTSI
jgi:ribose 5-phosphate isomerase B